MADTASVTIVKRFIYRGSEEEWSNTYHFDGGTPADATHWKALCDAVIGNEEKIYAGVHQIVTGIGHAPGVKPAVWEHDYSADTPAKIGTLTPSVGAFPSSGDVACWLRWGTATVTSRGKPIYLRNYYHGVWTIEQGGDYDKVDTAQELAMQQFGQVWLNGLSDGTSIHHRAGPHGAAGVNYEAGPYATTRTLKRRGKRRVAP